MLGSCSDTLGDPASDRWSVGQPTVGPRTTMWLFAVRVVPPLHDVDARGVGGVLVGAELAGEAHVGVVLHRAARAVAMRGVDALVRAVGVVLRGRFALALGAAPLVTGVLDDLAGRRVGVH